MYARNANGLVSNVAAPINGTATNLASSITFLGTKKSALFRALCFLI